MELKRDHKQTEVGAIPAEWETKKLGEFVRLQRGHDLTEHERRPGEVPVMSAAGQNGFHDKALATGPGVVVGRSGASFGQVHWCGTDYWPHNTALYVTDFCGNDPRFAFYFLKAQDFSRFNTGGAQPSLNRNSIYPIPVGVPQLPEQRAIAAALSDVDALIGTLDLAIAKKRDLKQAAMQQLLTGQTRLPGFHGEWEVKRLGEIGSFSKGRGLSKGELADSGSLAAIPYTAIYTDFAEVIACSKITNFLTSTSSVVIINGPHLLIAGSSNMLQNIGKASAYIDNSDVAVGGDIVIYRTTADVRFLSYLLSTQPHRKRVVFLSQGSTIRHVYRSTFEGYQIELPSHREQTAIVEVLSDMDAELAALEARRDKTRALKQGMMQELLTGRTRLV
jgi:type I restriction enzyme S subunit